MYQYRAKILKVVDGDTVHAALDLGLDVTINVTLRLAGINAPEMSTPEGVRSKEWLVSRLESTDTITGCTIKIKREKYGRYLAYLYIDNETESLNDQMLKESLAVVYPR